MLRSRPGEKCIGDLPSKDGLQLLRSEDIVDDTHDGKLLMMWCRCSRQRKYGKSTRSGRRKVRLVGRGEREKDAKTSGTHHITVILCLYPLTPFHPSCLVRRPRSCRRTSRCGLAWPASLGGVQGAVPCKWQVIIGPE